MKAAVYRGLNDVRLEEVPVPAIGRDEILVRVHLRDLRDGPQKDLDRLALNSPYLRA